MTDAFLKPPARFSHGLLLVLTVATALVLSSAVGQRSTLIVAGVTLVLFLAGFWAFSKQVWLYTMAGTVAVLLGSLGVTITVVWLGIQALGAPSVPGLFLNVGVTLALVGGVVAVVGDLVPSAVTEQDGPAIVALVYGGGLTTGALLALSAVQLGLASLFGMSVTATIGTTAAVLANLAGTNPITRFGSLLLLAGASFWVAGRLLKLPLSRRLSKWLADRWTDDERSRCGEAGPALAEQGNEQSDPGGSGDDRPSLGETLGIGPRIAAIPRIFGAASFYLGFGAFILGLLPEMETVARTHPVSETLGTVLSPAVGPQQVFAGVLVVLALARLGHAVAWRAVNVDWSTNERRFGYVAGSGLILLVAWVLGRPLVQALQSTPGFQLVPMGESGPVVVATDGGIRFAEAGLSGFRLQHRPDLFGAWIGDFVDLLGAPAFGIGVFSIVIVLSIVALVVSTLVAASARLTRPGAGIALLFVAAAGAAVGSTQTLLAFLAGLGALVAWEVYTHGASLHRQLDPDAATLRVELVHLGASIVLVTIAVVVTLAGVKALEIVPAPASQWQVFGALVLSLLALVLGLLYLGIRGDRTAERPDLG